MFKRWKSQAQDEHYARTRVYVEDALARARAFVLPDHPHSTGSDLLDRRWERWIEEYACVYWRELQRRHSQDACIEMRRRFWFSRGRRDLVTADDLRALHGRVRALETRVDEPPGQRP